MQFFNIIFVNFTIKIVAWQKIIKKQSNKNKDLEKSEKIKKLKN